jgi:hypothetical protein
VPPVLLHRALYLPEPIGRVPSKGDSYPCHVVVLMPRPLAPT